MKCSAVNTLPMCLLVMLWVGIATSVTVDLRTGSTSTLPTGVTWHSHLTSGTGTCQCDRQGVLKLTFDLESRVRAQINMTFEHSTGFTFNVGDSRSNNGYAGDSSSQSNDAEVHSKDNYLLFYGRDSAPGKSYGELRREKNFVGMQPYTTLTLNVQDHLVTADNGHTSVYMDTDKLFQLNGQSDREGPVNCDVYLGMNRVVSGAYRSGTGLCKVQVQFFNTRL